MLIRHLVLFVLLCFFACCCCFAQQSPDSVLAMSNKLQAKYLNAISAKSAKATEQIDKQTEKYLAKLEKQERRLQKKLAKIDSLAAKNVFANTEQKYRDLENRIKNKSESLLHKGSQYLPWLDSARTSLKFLETKNPVTGAITTNQAKLTGALSKVKELENQFKQAANVKDFIRQRKEYLKQQLQHYNLGNELKNYNQTAYYYSQQINEYRQALNDPDKAEKKVLELLNKVPVFQDFMRKNSMLASLFAVPGSDPNGLTQNLAGLQTRASVQGLIQNQLAAGGPNAQAMLQQNIGEAQGMLNQLKNKMSQMGTSGGSDLDMPEYKPNTQKTKPFLKRLEYGTNIQSAKSNYYFPTTTDIALSVGYKLNEKNIIGIGASYKMGWGKDFSHINLSSQGIGFRSFMDTKLKGSFYASGGFEYNYQQPFGSIEQIKYLNAWQQSGLIGISKIVSLKTKYFKKTKLQLLWDMLSYQQVPKTQPVKFRVGYSF